DTAFAVMAKEHSGPLVVSADNFFTDQLGWIARLASRNAIPAISAYREFAAAGGLMSYGANIADAYREVGNYAGRILKGAKPTDLPVKQAMRELALNLTTAHALDITVPLPLLYLANAVH